MKFLRNKKLIISLVCVLFISIVAIASAWGVSAASLSQATREAEKMVAPGASLLKAEKDGDEYVVKFYDAENKIKYEVCVDRKTKKVTELKTQSDIQTGSDTLNFTEDDIRTAVAAEYKGAIFDLVELSSESPQKYYVRFHTDALKGTMIIHPENGDVLERKIKYGTPIVIPVTQNSPAADGTSYLTPEKAAEIAKAIVHNGIITDIDFEKHSKGYVYEIELYKDGYEYDLVLDAVTGKQQSLRSHKEHWDDDDGIDWNYHHVPEATSGSTKAPATAGSSPSTSGTTGTSGSTASAATVPPSAASSPYIGSQRAGEIALQKAGGGTLSKIEFDEDDGRKIYEGKIIRDDTQYEFEIDARTGSILEWEQKRVVSSTKTALIGAEKAKSIALSKLPGATLVEMELEYDDGRLHYKGELVRDHLEAEFEIDAYTGTILDWELDDRDDS